MGKDNLDQPEDIVGAKVVLADPGRQGVPLHPLPAIDADAILCVLVFAGFQIVYDLPCELCQESSMQKIVLHQSRPGPITYSCRLQPTSTLNT